MYKLNENDNTEKLSLKMAMQVVSINDMSHFVQNAARLDSDIIYDRDFDYDYFVGIHKADIDSVLKTYHTMSQRWFTHASPTLFNAGTPRPQVSMPFYTKMLKS
jgi:ribonucleoside-diphosphate reductase subunit M1